MIKVAVVTPVHNRRELTLQCLRSLSRVDTTGLDLKIFVVDDGSTDGTAAAIAKQHPHVNVISGNGNLWYTAGTNLGVETALKDSPDYILGINDDSIFDELCIRRLIDCSRRNPKSVIGGLLLLWDQPHRVFQVAPVWDIWYGGWRQWRQQTVWSVPSTAWEVEAIAGNCVLFPASVFSEVGFMNPEVSAQYGDSEFSVRLRKNGWRLLIEPHARVFCQPNYSYTPIANRPLSKQFEALFDSRSRHSVAHQFRQIYYSAPNRFNGFISFLMHYVQVAKRKVSPASESKRIEPKLADYYSANAVKN